MSECDPVCVRCGVTSSLMWHRDQEGAVICLDCHRTQKAAQSALTSSESPTSSLKKDSLKPHAPSNSKPVPQVSTQPELPSLGVTTRRTTRSHERAKARQQQQQQQQLQAQQSNTSVPPSSSGNGSLTSEVSSASITTSLSSSSQGASSTKAESGKGSNTTRDKTETPSPPVVPVSGHGMASVSKNRRTLKQGQPIQAPENLAYTVTANSIEYMGTMFEVGDIVSLLDRDGGVYYAVARGFLLDQYANKYAILTWLLPKHPNPTHFDPAMFILGPEEDAPRSMDCIEFVSHSPQSRHFQSSYFHDMEQAGLWLSSPSH